METNLIQIQNIHSFCRTCLVTLTKQSNIGAQKFSIHETPDLSNWLQVFTSMEIGSNDIYPEFMCYECYEQIQNFLKFREMCKRSATTLDDILQNVQNQDPKLQDTTIKEEETEINNRIEFHKTVKEELSEAGENNIVCEFEAEDKSLVTSTFLIKYDITEHQTDCEDDFINKNDLVHQNCNSYNDYNDDNNINSEDLSDNSLDSKKYETNDATEKIDSSHLAKIGNKSRGKLKCRICSYGFYKKECLEIHIRRVHQGLKAFHCNYCNRGFNKSDQLNTHIQKAHANKFSEVKSKQQIKPEKFQCEDCGNILKNLSSFRKHRLKHVTPESYPYQCEHCSKRFIFRYRYKQHLDKHAGIKNFGCPYCGIKKTTMAEVHRHCNTHHAKEMHLPCPHCEMIFNNSGKLSYHIRSEHKGIRRFECSFCQEKFSRATTLRYHEMQHTNERPHECLTCNKRFIQPYSLKKHLKTHEEN